MKRENLITNYKSLILAIILVSTLLFGSCSKSGKPHYEAYLFAYFEGSAGDRQNQEQLRFAISNDALHWKALNNNEPIQSSEEISQSGGIRDPHILRAEDGKSFYLVATDMSTARNGWKSNPGIVMLKSNDLIHWEHSSVNLSKDYPEQFANAYWVWAPQTIYDPSAGKYLIYFTLKLENDDKLDFYSAYANKDFSGFEAAPTLMFSARHGAIDADIVYKDGTWHMFYKGNTKDEQGKEFENGIKQATAPSLQGPWTEHFEYLDVYHNSRTNVEGSSVFKLNDSDSYILMYDLYSSGRYEFQRSQDLYHFTDKPESFVKDFHPRHGSIIGITRKEAERLNRQWGDTAAREIAAKLSYTFEQQQAADDDNQFRGALRGNAQIIEMTDGNKVLFTNEGYMDLGLRGDRVKDFFTNDYSISIDLFIRPENALNAYCWLFALANGSNSYLGLVNPAGNKDWFFELKGQSAEKVNTGMGLAVNEWQNITLVKQDAQCRIYINGKEEASATLQGSAEEVVAGMNASWLGRSPYKADQHMRNAFIDNFRMYDQALTVSQINDLYKNTQTLAGTTPTDIDKEIIYSWQATGNPIVTHKYTADAAALVYKDTLFIFTGEDYEGGQSGYNIKNWCVFATTDMKNFWEYKIPLRATDFSWGEKNASWASQVIERNGKFYWYTSSQTTGIGVAVSDRPEGPYKDAIGKPLLTNKDSFGKRHSWRTIDPSVFIDDNGQAWLYWGNGACWLVKLNKDMVSYNRRYGVKMVDIQGEMEYPFTEAPWIHKKDGIYYLSFAVGFPERIAYATSDKPEGPYTYRGIINEIAGNSNTNHQAMLEYKGQWYFIYHNGGIQTDGGSYSRSVCIDLLEFDENGGYKPVQMTTRGVPVLE